MPLDQIEEEKKKTDLDESEMSFLEHLEALRWHLIRSILAILVFTIVAFIYGRWVFQNIIFAPSRSDFWTYRMLCELGKKISTNALCFDTLNFVIQSRQLSGQFMMHMTASVIIGLVIAFPYVFWEIWSFIKPGLYRRERKAASGATLVVSLLFMIGVFFGYYVLAPLSINFLANYQIDPSIKNEFDIISYVSTLITLVLACAILFQLPVLVYFLARIELLTASFMRTYRRHAIVVILILAGVITPPDVVSQILVALPLTVLYEISINIVVRVEKRRLKEEKRMEKLQTSA